MKELRETLKKWKAESEQALASRNAIFAQIAWRKLEGPYVKAK